MPVAPRTALVTGSNGGLGLALAKRLQREGWRVLLHGRNAAKLARARSALGGPAAFAADLADPAAVRALADDVVDATDRLDALVHNAGLVAPRLTPTGWGVELTAAVNVLAPYALTEHLRPLLRATAEAHGGARVVTVSSDAQRAAVLKGGTPAALADELRGPSGRYSPLVAYAKSKLAATTWTLELARRLDGTGVVAHACHPGVVRTGVFRGIGGVSGLMATLFSPLYLSPPAGARSPHMLVANPKYGRTTGRWVRRNHLRGPHPADPPALAADPAVGADLFSALGLLADA